MTPYALENLYHHLGKPKWYWHGVFATLFALLVIGSSVSPLDLQP